MAHKVKVQGSGEREVPGVGIVKAGSWVELSDEQVASLEARTGKKISELEGPGLEVKKVSAKKSKEGD